MMIRLLIFLMASLTTVWLASLAAAGTSRADSDSPCSADMVPIQIFHEIEPCEVTSLPPDINTTPCNMNTRYEGVTMLSDARIPDSIPGFAAFVTNITKHVASKLAQESPCLNNFTNRAHSLLQFVPVPVAISKYNTPTSRPPLGARPAGGCRISSPWIDLVNERGPVMKVRGIVRFSERQLMTDQAILFGARDVPPGAPRPMTRDEFNKYAFAYEGQVFYGQPLGKPIEEVIPPDFLWLVRRSGRNDRAGPFTNYVMRTRSKAMKAGAEGYTEVVMALMDHCLASGEADIQYNSLLDVIDLVPLEHYKIVTFIL